MTVDGHIMADIELSSLIKQRFFDIFLHDESPLSTICVPLFRLQTILYFVQGRTDCDSSTSIRQFSGLYNPNISKFSIDFFIVILPLKLSQKVLEFRAVKSLSDMKGDWNPRKRVFSHKFIIFSEGVKQCFFISEKIVALKMVVHPNGCIIFNVSNSFFL